MTNSIGCNWKFYLIILVLIVPTAFPVMSNTNGQTIVKVEPYQNVAEVSNQFSVNITVSDIYNLFGIEVHLIWNASILTPKLAENFLGVESHPNGILHENVSLIVESTTSSEYSLTATSTGRQTPSFNGSGTIARITFNVTDVGSCDVILESILYDKPSVEDETANPIAHLTTNGHCSPVYIRAVPAQIVIGDKLNVSGYVLPREGSINATIAYRQQDNTGWSTVESTATDLQGNYVTEWTPQAEGAYEVKTTAEIQGASVESAVLNISVQAKAEPELWLYIYATITVALASVIIGLVLYLRKKDRKT